MTAFLFHLDCGAQFFPVLTQSVKQKKGSTYDQMVLKGPKGGVWNCHPFFKVHKISWAELPRIYNILNYNFAYTYVSPTICAQAKFKLHRRPSCYWASRIDPVAKLRIYARLLFSPAYSITRNVPIGHQVLFIYHSERALDCCPCIDMAAGVKVTFQITHWIRVRLITAINEDPYACERVVSYTKHTGSEMYQVFWEVYGVSLVWGSHMGSKW